MRLARGCALVSCSAAVLSIAASSPALAAGEGPFFKISGARLALSASQEIETSAAKTFALTDALSRTIECTKAKNAAKDTFKGSNGANGSTSEEHLTFEGCTQVGWGPSGTCKLIGDKFETTALKNMLGFTNAVSVKSEALSVLFRPVTGSLVAQIKFTTTCMTSEASLEGSFAGEPSSKGKAVMFEEEPAEAESNEVNFPNTALKAVWLEEGGTRKELKVQLKSFGVSSKLTGTSSIKLKSKEKWGVFAK